MEVNHNSAHDTPMWNSLIPALMRKILKWLGLKYSLMGWKFWEKKRPIPNDPILKTYTIWLAELRETCEHHYNSPASGRSEVKRCLEEWNLAHHEGTLSKINLDGLVMRADILLTCIDDEWLTWLDNIDFWKPGWKVNQDMDD